MGWISKVLVACLVLLGSIAAIAQAPTTGLYAFGSFENKGFDTINRGNLNVHLTIPIVSKTGRGGTNFSYALNYDSLIWSPTTSSGTEQWTPSYRWGWTDATNAEFGYITYDYAMQNCLYGSQHQYQGTRLIEGTFEYHDQYGKVHPFPMSYTSSCPYLAGPLGTGTYATSDNSGYTIYRSNSTYVVFSSNGAQSAVAAYGDLEGDSTLQEGTGAATYTDTNGNEISASSTGVFTDTTGKTVLTLSGSGTSSSPAVYTYTDSNGNPQDVAVNYTAYTLQTNFGVSGIAEYSQSGVPLVSSIVYPDGSAYAFTYEPTPGNPSATTGRIASITLRTGGVISYAYSGGNHGIESDGSTAGLTRTTTDGTGSYTRSAFTPTSSTTTIADPAGNDSVYTFLENSAGYIYENSHSIYTGAISGTPVEAVTTCYSASSTCINPSVSGAIASITTTTTRNGTTIGTDLQTFTGPELLASDTGPTNIVTNYSYQSFTGLYSIPFYRLASQSNGQSSTTYKYDETTPTPTSGLPQHVAVSTSRGNLTSIHPGTYTQTLTYDDAGQVLSESDLNANLTNLKYDTTTDTFLTSVTYPTVNGVVLTKGFTPDINTGLTTSSTDMNGNTTSYHYDGLLRPTEIDYPDGGKALYSYSSIETAVHRYQNANTYSAVDTEYDAYDRTSRVAILNGQGSNPWYQSDICYDADGNSHFQSYWYQSDGFAAPKVCSGSGDTYTHDVLGRVTNVQHSDATQIAYTYTGTATKVTDENGVSRIVQTDAIGRPSILCEISSNASMPGSGSPQSCGTTLSGTGFLTTYSYDWANAKTTVTQGAQTRIFQTDSLGRTILVQEPESGATTYSYAYNSTGLVVTRKRPRANQSSASVLTTTTTQYDKLGRVVSITYNDGVTPNKEFDYDTVNSAMQWSQSTSNLKGNLADMASGSGTTLTRDLFSYDAMGRVTAMWQCAPSICGTSSQAGRPLTFSYDWTGNLISEADAASGTITYGYSPADEVTAITGSYNNTYNPPNLISSVQNGPNGPLNWQIGNGTAGVLSYDSLGRNNGDWLCRNSTAAYCTGGTKTYGNTITVVGTQVQSECDTVLNNCETLGYDEFNRLKSLTVTSGTTNNFSYVYDRYGNRWQQNITAGSGPSPQLSFNTANNQVTNGGIQYDAAGNLVNDSTHSYKYDAEGNLISVDSGATAINVYDALNRRVRVQTASATDEYTFDYANRLISTWLPNGAGIGGRIYWGDRMVAFRAQNGDTYFDQKDILGTDRLRMNYAAVAAANYTSLPFGDAYTPHVSGSYGDQDNNHFALLDRDAESGTDHAQFRQYDNTWGRWMSPDPYNGSYDITNPQSFNRYSYGQNNPMVVFDPSGLVTCTGADVFTVNGDGSMSESGLDISCPGGSNGGGDTGGAYGGYAGGYSGSGAAPYGGGSPGHGGGTGGGSTGSGANGNSNNPSQAPNNGEQKTQQCVSNFYNSKLGKAVQFGSPLSLLPVWNPGWGNNMKEWGVAIVGKVGGLFGSGATPGTNQLTTLSGTKTVGSAPELATEGTLGAIEKFATPAMALATIADIMAHGTCAMMADPAAANAALQSVP